MNVGSLVKLPGCSIAGKTFSLSGPAIKAFSIKGKTREAEKASILNAGRQTVLVGFMGSKNLNGNFVIEKRDIRIAIGFL